MASPIASFENIRGNESKPDTSDSESHTFSCPDASKTHITTRFSDISTSTQLPTVTPAMCTCTQPSNTVAIPVLGTLFSLSVFIIVVIAIAFCLRKYCCNKVRTGLATLHCYIDKHRYYRVYFSGKPLLPMLVSCSNFQPFSNLFEPG
jgi:hypothetical protein